MNEKDLQTGDLDLEDIMKEFGEEEAAISEEEVALQDQTELEFAEAEEAEEPAPEPEPEPEEIPEPTFPEPKKPEEVPPAAQPEQMDLAEELVPPAPIPFRPRSMLKDLKRKLIAGPEKRYYELSEQGLGKLQMAMFLCLVAILAAVGAAALYTSGRVPDSRLRLMVFSQILIMLFGGLLASHQMIEGVTDLFQGRFNLNTMLAITFAACCADGALCLLQLRVPLCAAFTLQAMLSLWAEYHRRVTEMGQMDTLRKAIRLESLVMTEDYREGRPGILRGQGDVDSLMDSVRDHTGPEKAQSIYALVALGASAAVAALAGVLNGVSMAVQIFSTTLLVAVPASFFVSVTRPWAVLEKRLHSLGTVICGWKGVRELCKKACFPLKDGDLFPTGSVKLNGVKFYGSRDPEETISFTVALMRENGGTLAPIFVQLLESRSGVRYEAYDMHYYGNGGIGGMVCDEPVLMGSLDFLQEMGVEIPEGVMVKQAVYVAIDGELSGLFAISYNRMKYASQGLAALCGCRNLTAVMLAEDFMLTSSFLKERFGIKSRRVVYPPRQERDALAKTAPQEDAAVLAMTTQEGLAPAVSAITGALALNTACRLGLIVHMLGGILGIAIMAALAVVGAVQLLEPIHILLYQLVWLVPGVLVTFWPRTIG